MNRQIEKSDIVVLAKRRDPNEYLFNHLFDIELQTAIGKNSIGIIEVPLDELLVSSRVLEGNRVMIAEKIYPLIERFKAGVGTYYTIA